MIKQYYNRFTENDFLRELKYVGITDRLKRLSNNLSTNIKELYKEKDLDIKPSWNLIFLFLKYKNQSTMSEIAEALHYSQPAITKIINRVEIYLDFL